MGHYLRFISLLLYWLFIHHGVIKAEEYDFNLDLVDVVDRENIDFSQFNNSGFIYPGIYKMKLVVNAQTISEQTVNYVEAEDNSSKVCYSSELIHSIGLKNEYLDIALSSLDGKGCYNLDGLKGIVVKGTLNNYSLNISVPQEYMQNTYKNWDLPSNWDNGVNGVIIDYGINVRYNNRYQNGDSTDVSAYGVAGINTGAWRWRADWNGMYTPHSSAGVNNNDFTVNRLYGYRAIPDLTAKLIVGEIDLGTSVFDSFQFLGASLVTDENMLPPNLRGYAPEVVGIAKTNAKVVISQNGRVLYETQVAAGPFRVQDLNQSISGTLDVRVEEQDGTEQNFQVNTASIPYLSRPGTIRYKLAAGKATSSYREHRIDGPEFFSGELSMGVSNTYSVFGGGLLSDGYGSLVAGIGRDLFEIGAISFDITRSWARVPDNGTKSGNSYRVNYSKSFSDYDSQITFAAYRFSEEDFLNMNDYLMLLNAPSTYEAYSGNSKELYSVILSKQFRDLNLGAYVDFTHQSYWDNADRERISVSVSSHFDLLDWKNLSVSMTGYRSEQNGVIDNGMYVSINAMLGQTARVSYSLNKNNTNIMHNVSYMDRIDDRNTYSLTAGASSNNDSVLSGFYSHVGDNNSISANFNHQSDVSTGLGLSMYGGVTAIADGSTALHRNGTRGGTRMMVDTDGAADIPIKGSGPSVKTNVSGKAVLADLSSYYRHSISVDVNELGRDVEYIGSPVKTGTLTEGAIGYHHFDMLSGAKRLTQITLANGKYAPFSAVIHNDKKQQMGMVSDDGVAYLIGLNKGETLSVSWGEKTCSVVVPTKLPDENELLKFVCL
ncbi:fimbria/pilus outer membrane usher protein [Aeromonas dhakensis]|uniref:fimbria/pilus outer membrane usher protein n=1 Tax=Aeromonas dhakensis TaxID=196024 RepID=UPI0038CFF770